MLLLFLFVSFVYGETPQNWPERRSKELGISTEQFHRFQPPNQGFLSIPNQWFLPTATKIQAQLENEIYSYNIVAPATAILTEPAICPKNGNVVLPKGTRFFGSVAVVKTREEAEEVGRVNIEFTVCILPNGAQFSCQAMALSWGGAAGVRGKLKNFEDKQLASAILVGGIQGVANSLAFTAANPITGAAAGGLSATTGIISDDASKNVSFSVRVPRGETIDVLIIQPIILDSAAK